MQQSWRWMAVLFAVTLHVSGCKSKADAPAMAGTTGGTTGGTPDPVPFQPSTPATYVAKVKALLVSAAPTAAEVAQVEADPNALSGLISQWMLLPQYSANMQAFFANAFQQSLATANDYQTLGINYTNANLIDNLNTSFARSALAAAASNQPFNTLMSTQQIMMTVPMMAYYAALDAISVDDTATYTDLATVANPNLAVTVETSAGPVPIADSINPNSANYMVWYNPSITHVTNPNVVTFCTSTDPLVLDRSNTSPKSNLTSFTQNVFRIIMGHAVTYTANRVVCSNGTTNAAYITPDDYQQWKWVSVRPPNAGETPTRFYDLPTLRSSNVLVLKTPRVGFFTTPSFLAQWNTNSSNQARVTMNQTLITALGHAFDGSTQATPGMNMAALDAVHAAPQTPCFGCHQTLDPMRQFFLQQYTYTFSVQQDSNDTAIAGWFDFAGTSVAGDGISSLGIQLSNHPALAAAWTQNLCTYANSVACSTTDPEFLRIAAAFSGSNFSWNTLVLQLFASPIVTYAQPTQSGAVTAEAVSISRQYELCTALSQRLAVNDICGLNVNTVVPSGLKSVQIIAAGMPADSYSRGSVIPPLVTEPGLFYRAGVENICAEVAAYVIDNGSGSKYQSTNATAAIADFVNNVMGVAPGQDAALLAILTAHNAAALQSGASATTALQSTFMLACLSPTLVGVGIGQ